MLLVLLLITDDTNHIAEKLTVYILPTIMNRIGIFSWSLAITWWDNLYITLFWYDESCAYLIWRTIYKNI